MKNNSGQSLVELMISFALVTVCVTGAGWVLRAEFNRGKCAYFVFQRTRQSLNHLNVPLGVGSDPLIRMTDSGREVAGEAKCGDALESVHLRRLEWPI